MNFNIHHSLVSQLTMTIVRVAKKQTNVRNEQANSATIKNLSFSLLERSFTFQVRLTSKRCPHHLHATHIRVSLFCVLSCFMVRRKTKKTCGFCVKVDVQPTQTCVSTEELLTWIAFHLFDMRENYINTSLFTGTTSAWFYACVPCITLPFISTLHANRCELLSSPK